ncbi:hypothetical protein BCR42DRAFT_434982 [Absidia repens]|uniref:PH domain-containing protein n=1 Tax=Absidia repens TaxID=90262 RepID=A0A1X2IQR8_9FUNG|nr:hypothetical protein BCR42DRAFT_434982 [Absidia repens]
MSTSESSSLQGWLLKQKHGLYRSWLKRYFVLHGRELSYYRNETDKVPQNVLDLDHYTISFKKQSRRNCTFILVAEEHHMQPDYYLQAETKDDLDVWISHLQQHMSTSSVLDKWLERLDMTCAPPPPPSSPPTLRDNQTVPCASLLAPTLSYHPHHPHHPQQPPSHHHQHPSSLRSHRSVESIHTFCSLPSVSHRVSFTNDRRPSSQSTHSNSSDSSSLSHASNSTTATYATDTSTPYRFTNAELPLTTNSSISNSSSSGNNSKFFTSRIFSRKHPQRNSNKQSSVDTINTPHESDYSPTMLSLSTPSLLLATCSSASADTMNELEEQEQGSHMPDSKGIKQQQALNRHFFSSSSSSSASSHVCPLLATSIIHPSEYNHDDDPQERLRRRQQQLPRGHSCSSFHYSLDTLGLASSTDTSS